MKEALKFSMWKTGYLQKTVKQLCTIIQDKAVLETPLWS